MAKGELYVERRDEGDYAFVPARFGATKRCLRYAGGSDRTGA